MRRRGVSLLEAVVVVAIIALISALAAPNLLRLIQRSRVVNVGKEFGSIFVNARTQAVTRGFPSTVCLSGPAFATFPNQVRMVRKAVALAPGAVVTPDVAGIAPADFPLENWFPSERVVFAFAPAMGVAATASVQVAFDMNGVPTVFTAADCQPATARTPVAFAGAPASVEFLLTVSGDASITQIVRLRSDGSLEYP